MDSLPTTLMMIAVALLVLEIFIPSGGVLGALAGIVLIVGVGAAYVTQGAKSGTLHLLAVVLVLPPLIYGAIKLWPNTYLGRLILISPPTEDETVPQVQQDRREYLGEIGEAVTALLPSGAIRIGGRTIDAISDGMTIDRGTPVEIIAVRGTHLIVRPATSVQVSLNTEPHDRPSPVPELSLSEPQSTESNQREDDEAGSALSSIESISAESVSLEPASPESVSPEMVSPEVGRHPTEDATDRLARDAESAAEASASSANAGLGDGLATHADGLDDGIDHRRFDDDLDDVLDNDDDDARS